MSISGNIPDSQISQTGPLIGPQAPKISQEGPSVGTTLPADCATSSRITKNPPSNPQEKTARSAEGKANAAAAENLRTTQETRGQAPTKDVGGSIQQARPRQAATRPLPPPPQAPQSSQVSSSSPPPRPPRPELLLCIAAKNGDLEKVKILLELKEMTPQQIHSARMQAKEGGHTEVAKFLFSKEVLVIGPPPSAPQSAEPPPIPPKPNITLQRPPGTRTPDKGSSSEKTESTPSPLLTPGEREKLVDTLKNLGIEDDTDAPQSRPANARPLPPPPAPRPAATASAASPADSTQQAAQPRTPASSRLSGSHEEKLFLAALEQGDKAIVSLVLKSNPEALSKETLQKAYQSPHITGDKELSSRLLDGIKAKTFFEVCTTIKNREVELEQTNAFQGKVHSLQVVDMNGPELKFKIMLEKKAGTTAELELKLIKPDEISLPDFLVMVRDAQSTMSTSQIKGETKQALMDKYGIRPDRGQGGDDVVFRPNAKFASKSDMTLAEKLVGKMSREGLRDARSQVQDLKKILGQQTEDTLTRLTSCVKSLDNSANAFGINSEKLQKTFGDTRQTLAEYNDATKQMLTNKDEFFLVQAMFDLISDPNTSVLERNQGINLTSSEAGRPMTGIAPDSLAEAAAAAKPVYVGVFSKLQARFNPTNDPNMALVGAKPGGSALQDEDKAKNLEIFTRGTGDPAKAQQLNNAWSEILENYSSRGGSVTTMERFCQNIKDFAALNPLAEAPRRMYHPGTVPRIAADAGEAIAKDFERYSDEITSLKVSSGGVNTVVVTITTNNNEDEHIFTVDGKMIGNSYTEALQKNLNRRLGLNE